MRFLFFLILLLFMVPQVTAYDPSKPNNKFGIHLAQPDTELIKKASELVNTNGDWGYITLVIQENDRDLGKWQNVFNELRKHHLIPIIRIATQPEGAAWRRPNPEDINAWVTFLNSLHWVVKDRYVVLFNEPNHGAEWGGEVDPESFRKITLEFAKKLKEKNKDFYIMLAGFDASAPSARPAYEDEANYLSEVFTEDTIDDWNKVLSGWSSHSYPNPGFVGSPYGIGRGSIRNYQWEKNLLSSLGLKDLPVFITETGWDGNKISRAGVADHFLTAFSSTWLPDDDVAAVTPFILDYQTEPFLNFSWKMPGSDEFYNQFYTVKDMEKDAGRPNIKDAGGIFHNLPKELVINSNFQYVVEVKNRGQAYWDDRYNYRLEVQGLDEKKGKPTYLFSDISDVFPGESQELDFFFKTGSQPGKKKAKLVLMRDDQKIIDGPVWNFEIVPLPSLKFNVSLHPRLRHKGDDFELQIFDQQEKLVYKKKNVSVESTEGKIESIQNIALGEPYRIVILKPYYLPRQTFVIFKKGENQAIFERMYPLDFDKDGALRLNDAWALIQNPSQLKLLLP